MCFGKDVLRLLSIGFALEVKWETSRLPDFSRAQKNVKAVLILCRDGFASIVELSIVSYGHVLLIVYPLRI